MKNVANREKKAAEKSIVQAIIAGLFGSQPRLPEPLHGTGSHGHR